MQKILIVLIRAYAWLISPVLGPCCRFHPTCSSYAQEAIRKYGAARGTVMTVSRLCRCHPLHPGGYDPVK